jgi:aspartate racemase
MKTAGIIGGIAPESTIVYYREIVKQYLQYTEGKSYPQVIINSIDMNRMLSFIPGNLPGMVEYVCSEINKLKAAGADFAVLASNTPHIAFNKIRNKSTLPLLSIVELACQKVKSLGYNKVGLFGTKSTMSSHFYQDVFSTENISVVVPSEEEQNYIHKIYFGELVKGIFLPETKQKLLQIIDSMHRQYNLSAIILGGTELPLILKDGDAPGTALLDTTLIHVEGILKELI